MTRIIRNLNGRVIVITAAFSLFFSAIMVVHAAEPSGALGNPLKDSISSIPAFVAEVLKAIVVIGLPIITLFIVISGFMFLWARGNPGNIDKAKQNFMWVIVGTLLILGAWVLVTLIAGTVNQLVGKS